MLPTCNTFWMGAPLGPVERACLRSVARQGHRVILYSYGPVDGAPTEVEVRDAREVLPLATAERLAKANYALAADLFRYTLLSRGAEYWVDADVYCLRPLAFAESYVFGWEAPGLLGNAILKIVADSPLLAALIEVFEGRECPPWAGRNDRRVALRQLKAGERINLGALSWGVGGPQALSWLTRKSGLDCFALPRSAFYPIYYRQADWILDPARPLEAIAGPETYAVHLWNKEISRFKAEPAPAGSFLARLQAEGA
ncbi:hypothetical protein [Caulobacter sp. 17J65-9]|uniref:hypothetical protein n=1 Tax=Caulobacter sp. 17J65-9 TaxID=2709382 RepID=UPI0013C67742|nr:hypothetical protein [Caulobacter sp. 17J65-9]NEX92682.1 hypothetical protein [Caulobacter sp. 17J65-9]